MTGESKSLCESRRSGELADLEAAFTAWHESHGIIWFDTDRNLAQAIAEVLGIEIHYESEDDA